MLLLSRFGSFFYKSKLNTIFLGMQSDKYMVLC
jgi:hypothetical protein